MSTMKTRQEIESRSVAEQAAEWLLLLEDPRPEDRESFADWLSRSPLHVSAFLRASAVDSLLDEVDSEGRLELDLSCFGGTTNIAPMLAGPTPSEGTGAIKHEQSGHGGLRRRYIPIRWFSHWSGYQTAIAACLVTVFFAALLLCARFLISPPSHYITAVGEERSLVLEDGSEIFLAPSSKLDVIFTAGERRLHLRAGEATFRVRHDATRPFRVYSGPVIVEAIGTEFNVNQLHGESVVGVIEGVVKVTGQLTSASHPALGQAVHLAAGQQTHVSGEGSVGIPTRANVDQLKSWRERRLTFVNENVFTIAEEFNRYNRAPKIRIIGTAAGERRYTAVFDANDLSSLISVLEKDPGLTLEHSAAEIVVRSTGDPAINPP